MTVFAVEASALRASRMRAAVVTALASKIAGIGVQLLAIPLAVRALGPQQFALYAMMAAAAGWLTLAGVGVGPSLTVRVASCLGDQRRESHLFLSGLFPVALASIAAGAAFLAASWMLPLATIFGQRTIVDATEVRLGLSVLAVMLVLQAIASVVESAQIGYQETHIQNIRGLVGNLATVATVVSVATWWPSIIGLILAVSGPALLARLVNGIQFLTRRPHLLAHARSWSPRDSWALVRDGISFAMAGGVGAFLTVQAPVILVGRTVGTIEAASFAAAMNLFVVAAGMVTMVMTPLWPAVADAMAHRDRLWLQGSYRRLLGFGLAYALAAAASVGAGGHLIMRFWVGPAINMTPELAAAWAVAFVCHVWEYLHYMWLTGAGRIASSSLVYLGRAAGSALVMAVLVGRWGTAVPFLTFAVMVCTSSGWIFRRMYRNAIGAINSEA